MAPKRVNVVIEETHDQQSSARKASGRKLQLSADQSAYGDRDTALSHALH